MIVVFVIWPSRIRADSSARRGLVSIAWVWRGSSKPISNIVVFCMVLFSVKIGEIAMFHCFHTFIPKSVAER